MQSPRLRVKVRRTAQEEGLDAAITGRMGELSVGCSDVPIGACVDVSIILRSFIELSLISDTPL